MVGRGFSRRLFLRGFRLCKSFLAVFAGLGAENCLYVLGHYDLLGNQLLGELVESVPVLEKELARALGYIVHEGFDLRVDQLRSLLAVGFGKVVSVGHIVE